MSLRKIRMSSRAGLVVDYADDDLEMEHAATCSFTF